MATDEELQALAEAAVNPEAMATPSPAPAAAVIGTPESPGIPPVAPVPPEAPASPTVANAVPGASSGVSAPVTIPHAGVDTRALDIARQSGTELAEAQGAKTPLIKDAAEAEATGLENKAQLQRDQQVEVSAEEQAQKDGLAKAQSIADAAHQEVKDFKPHDFWGDRTSGQAIRSNIAYALGGWTSSQLGGPNQVAEKIKSKIETQFRKDQMQLSSLENFAKYKQQGVTDLREQYRDDLAKLNLKHALALGAVADEAKAMLLRKNVPLQEADNNVLVKHFQAERDKAYADGFEKLLKDKAMMALERAKLANSSPEDPAKLAIIAKAAEMPGVTQADLYALAQRIGIRDVNKAVLPVQKDPDKEAAAKSKAEAEKAIGNVYDVNGKVIGNISTGNASFDSKKAQDISKANEIYADLRATVKALDESIKTEGKSVPSVMGVTIGDTAAKRETLNSHALIQLKELAKLGVLAGPDMGIMEQQLGGTKSNAAGMSNPKLSSLIDILDKKHEKFLGSNGVRVKDGAAAVRGEAPAAESKGSGVPSAEKIRALPEADRKDAIEASAALLDPKKREKAEKFLRHLGVM